MKHAKAPVRVQQDSNMKLENPPVRLQQDRKQSRRQANALRHHPRPGSIGLYTVSKAGKRHGDKSVGGLARPRWLEELVFRSCFENGVYEQWLRGDLLPKGVSYLGTVMTSLCSREISELVLSEMDEYGWTVIENLRDASAGRLQTSTLHATSKKGRRKVRG